MKYTQKFKFVISGVISAIMAISTVSITQIQAKSAEEVTTEIDISATDYLLGDVNIDGEFDVLDVVILKKWLSGKGNLNYWQNADFNDDGIINIFDWCLMKKNLINKMNPEIYPVENPDIIDEFEPCTATLDEYFDTWHFEIYIKHQYSVRERVWTIEDFQGIENIENLYIHRQYETESPYRQVLEISLKNQRLGQEEILKIIRDIESLQLPEIWHIEVTTTGAIFGDGDDDIDG